MSDYDWKVSPEAEEIVTKLTNLYPEKFNHIDPGQIGCCAITGKDIGKSQDWDAKIVGITEPQLLFSKKTYVIYFNEITWDKYDKRQRAAMLFRQMIRIKDEFDGGLNKVDLQDCACLVKAFGVDYMNSMKLPDLTEEKQPL